MGWFSSRSRDEQETVRLIGEVTRLRERTKLRSLRASQDFIIDILVEVCDESDLCLSSGMVSKLADIGLNLLLHEPFCIDVERLHEPQETLEDEVEVRALLRHAVHIYQNEDHYLGLWRNKLKQVLHSIIDRLPVNLLIDPAPDGSVPHETVLSPEAPLATFIDDFPAFLSQLIVAFYDNDVADAGLFAKAREHFEKRYCIASGIDWEDRHTTKRQLVHPYEQKNLSSEELSDLYTNWTYFQGLFRTPVPIPIPQDVRFEHMHIIGGTGHGKTQLLQYLIQDDLRRALKRKQSVVVMDPDGTLLNNLSRLEPFGDGRLGQRAIFIDPTDSECPVGLNLFDISQVEGADRRAQETIENNTIELFEYFFDALLGSELTSRQATLFRYLGLLLMQIPGGNIHTLRELMEDGERYRPYMVQMTGTARTFFETRFFDKSLNTTKQQILARLWGVLSNRALDRVFSATMNTVKLDEAMLSGKIIFINTSKEYLGEEGSHIFARMMVALLGQGLMRRAAIAPIARTDTFIYLDEAEGVIDQTLIRLLAQVRKYRGAITIAHQHLDQLSASGKSGVLANTSIKLAGGVSAQDASKLASEFRVDSQFILAQRKDETQTNFALFAKNITPQAMPFAVPLGFVEGLGRLSETEHTRLIERSRKKYGLPPDQHPPSPEPPSSPDAPPDKPAPAPASTPADISPERQPSSEPEKPQTVEAVSTGVTELPVEPASAPVYAKEGGGGARHRELEALVKELGEAAGYRASIEEVILDGEGRADVILRKDSEIICVEVSVTTTREHELLNVQKCLRFGADKIWLVAGSARHRKSLEKHIVAALSDSERAKILFLTEDDLPDQFKGQTDAPEETETIVRGYKVRSSAKSKRFLRDRIERAFDDR
ncbi:MAG: type IV secretory system conjugative DNA transfer family protein [Parasphingopyxis sp.]|uniref:type IV secretory system conjugative DNA transfer family protein n=1 Tax=Parasphingopyxis sp. TaxID=1920299 RepID=UPI003FA12A86